MKIHVHIHGEPKGKGAPRTRLLETKDKRIIPLVYKSKASKHWETAIYAQAADIIPSQLLDEPIAMDIIFGMPRPQSHFGKHGVRPSKADPRHAVKPDMDNLLKTLDVLTRLRLWRDDSRIWSLTAKKVWVPGAPGADIIVSTGDEVNSYEMRERGFEL